MNLEVQSRLSFYKKIADLGSKENVCLVQHIETGQIYVKKELDVYDRKIYDILMKENIPMTPKVYECLEDDDKLYIIEEYIHGITLESYIEKYGCLTPTQAEKVLLELCSILNTLHNRSTPIIHRDIKPTNIILCGEFEHSSTISSVYLIDFNTARKYSGNAEHDTVQMGTMGFAAPEQYGFGQSDARTDIYALGVVTNYMLCGKMISDEVYSCEDNLSKIIAKATKIDPEQRYQNVREIVQVFGYDESMSGSFRNNDETDTKDSKKDNWTRFFPPGFRSGNISHMLVAGMYYIISIWVSFTLEPETNGEPATGTDLFANRISCLLIFIFCALFWGNYLDVWDKLPLMKRKGGRVAGIVVYTVAITCFFMIILVAFEDLLLS